MNLTRKERLSCGAMTTGPVIGESSPLALSATTVKNLLSFGLVILPLVVSAPVRTTLPTVTVNGWQPVFSIVKVRFGCFLALSPFALAVTVPKSRELPPPSRIRRPWPVALPLPASSVVRMRSKGSLVTKRAQARTGPQALGVKTTFTVTVAPGSIAVVGQPVRVNRAVLFGSAAAHCTRLQASVRNSGALPVFVIRIGR